MAENTSAPRPAPRKPASTTVGSKESREALNEAAKAALAVRHRAIEQAKQRQPRESGSMTGLFITIGVLVVLVALVLYWTVSTISKPAHTDTDAVRAAMERLKQKGPKDPKDMSLVLDKIFKIHARSDVEELLGEPDIEAKDSIVLFATAPEGCYNFSEPGQTYLAYYQKEPPNIKTKYIPIYLFEVSPTGKATYAQQKKYPREKPSETVASSLPVITRQTPPPNQASRRRSQLKKPGETPGTTGGARVLSPPKAVAQGAVATTGPGRGPGFYPQPPPSFTSSGVFNPISGGAPLAPPKK